MLASLSIRDVVLIEKLELDFDRGLCALTGETGAGKSILLDALGLALGSAVVGSMAVATTVGVAAPVAFKRIGIDPAIAAGPFVTTACDVLGVGVYLMVALLILA